MKVLFLNTFHKGGAAVAARRLGTALSKSGVEITFGTFYPENYVKYLIGIGWKNKLAFIKDRLLVWRILKKKSNLYKYSSGLGNDAIFREKAFLDADIIHLHWVHFGFLGVDEITKIISLKPTVWTMHDMWAFTGGCHYSADCTNYLSTCESCFYLKKSSEQSRNLLMQKNSTWKAIELNMVACSNWLAESAQRSYLFHNRKEISVIGNTLDLEIFKPLNKEYSRNEMNLDSKAFYVLCGAMDFSDERKGFGYLTQSLRLLKDQIPNMVLLLFGSNADSVEGIESISLGHFSAEADLAKVYNVADVFVLPSIQDNLPNTVLESMACGTPCVSFDEGGMEDMIDHLENGFLAYSRNIESLAEGIKMFRDPKIRTDAGVQARQKIETKFSEEVIAEKYRLLYNQVREDFLIE